MQCDLCVHKLLLSFHNLGFYVHAGMHLSVGSGLWVWKGITGFLPPFRQQWVGRVLNGLDFDLLIINSHCGQGTSHFLLDLLPNIFFLLQDPAGMEWSLRNLHGLINPRMIHELCDGHPLGGLSLQEGPDEPFCFL